MASIGLLAAGVAHEVNTPLTGISSFTQMLLEGSDPEDPRTRLLEKIERQTFRAAKIVNGLLNLSRPPGRLAAKWVRSISMRSSMTCCRCSSTSSSCSTSRCAGAERRTRDGPRLRAQVAAGLLEPVSQREGRDAQGDGSRSTRPQGRQARGGSRRHRSRDPERISCAHL